MPLAYTQLGNQTVYLGQRLVIAGHKGIDDLLATNGKLSAWVKGSRLAIAFGLFVGLPKLLKIGLLHVPRLAVSVSAFQMEGTSRDGLS